MPKTYEANGSIQVVRRICGVCTDPVLRCFDNPDELNGPGTSLGGLILAFTS
jgi:hypothetical protein